MGRYANWISNLTVNQACAHICWFESNPAHHYGGTMFKFMLLIFILYSYISFYQEWNTFILAHIR